MGFVKQVGNQSAWGTLGSEVTLRDRHGGRDPGSSKSLLGLGCTSRDTRGEMQSKIISLS